MVSQYIGAWPVAEAFVQLNETMRRERQAERRAIEQIEAADRELACLGDRFRDAAVEVLGRSGFHRHKGQWRKRQNRK